MQKSSIQPLLQAGIIVGTSLLLGILFTYLFYEKAIGISATLFVVSILAGLAVIATALRRSLHAKLVFLIVPLLFFSSMLFVRASDFLTVLNSIAVILLLLLIAQNAFSDKLQNFTLRDYFTTMFLPMHFTLPFAHTLADILTLRGLDKDQDTIHHIKKGILITIPIFSVFFILLSSADSIFKKYFGTLSLFHPSQEMFSLLSLTTVVSAVFIGAYTYIIRQSSYPSLQTLSQNRTFGIIESSILLGSLNLLFFTFILIQITYLFGGEGTVASQGFTYAEYARNGFFQLIAVAILSFIVLLSTEKYIVKQGSHHSIAFTTSSTILIAQVFVIMISAHTRLSLYESAYGFTTLRLYSHTFICVLIAIFIALLFKIYQRLNDVHFSQYIIIFGAVFLMGMNLLNPDDFIARKNMDRYAQTKTIDSHYLASLSDDALPTSILFLSLATQKEANEYASTLYPHALKITQSPYFSGWQSFHLARTQSKPLIDKHFEELTRRNDMHWNNH